MPVDKRIIRKTSARFALALSGVLLVGSPVDVGAETSGEIGPQGTVNDAPFTTRGVLARRLRPADPTIEIRLMSRGARCENFDEDYRGREDEPVVVMFLEWPVAPGRTFSLGAAQTDNRLQFCKGRGGERGRVRCGSRAPDQGAVTVTESSPEGGVLSFAVESPKGRLQGELKFQLCPS